MAKILTGSTISYGATLPPASSTVDGSLFYLTTGYTDPNTMVVRTPGLHLFSFQIDVSSIVAGEQVGQGWQQLSTLDQFVKVTGDTMTGPLNADAGVRAMRGYPTSNNSTVGYSFGIDGDTGMFRDPGATNAATDLSFYVNGIERFKITTAGAISASGSTVWHAGNDGASSGLDADLLDGQHGAYYLNVSNATGSLNLATNTTGILPVSRGGTGATAALTAGGVMYASSTTTATSSAGGVAGQVLQSNGASAPLWVNQSTLRAGTAISADLGSFWTAAGPAGVEGNFQAVCTGYPNAVFYNNASDWGLYSSAHGSIISLNRGTGFVTIGNILTNRTNNTGSFYATGDVVAYSSDARLKKNIKIIPNALDKIKTLGGYEYDWDLEKTRKLGFKPSNPHEHGLLAQEVQKVLPDAVAEAPFNADYLTVKYERLVALLVAGMNEQQEQIDMLRKELQAVYSKL